MPTKEEIRKNLLRCKLVISEDESLAILKQAQAMLTERQVVGIYFPLPSEPDIIKLTDIYPNLTFCLPKITTSEMRFAHYTSGEKLQQIKLFPNLMEPLSNIEIVPDIIFVPGIAFDLSGRRLGFGKGYYDKYASKHKGIMLVGVTSSQRLLHSLPFESHDCKMDYILTEHITLKL